VFDQESGDLDYKELLSTVNRDQVFKRIEKTYPEMVGTGKFLVTEDTIEEENWSRLPEKEKRKISSLAEKAKKSEDLKTVIRDLLSYKQNYPDVPAIYNYLGIAYQKAHQLKDSYRILVETREKFPDYLFGKLSMAEYYLSINRFRKIPGLLENKFEITQHHPEGTEAFHISEVRAFYCITGLYFAKVGKIELAYKSYFLLSDLDINAQVTSLLGHQIIGYESNGLRKKMRSQRKRGKW
jgi:tetratricopeptide (TPR) repeat protein